SIGAEWSPDFAQAKELVTARARLEIVHELRSHPQAEVVDREDVGSTQGEDKDHLGRPPANSLYPNQAFDRLLVGRFRDGRGVQLASRPPRRQIAHIGDLRPR